MRIPCPDGPDGIPRRLQDGGRHLKEKRQQTLLEARTEWIGDASAVGKLVNALPLPQGVKREQLSLQTGSEPYGLTVAYSAVGGNGPSDCAWMYRNATLLLSLIGNAERVVFLVDEESFRTEFLYTREQAERRERSDVRALSKSASSMEKFLAGLEGRNTADYARFGGSETEGLLTKEQARAAAGKRAGISASPESGFRGTFRRANRLNSPRRAERKRESCRVRMKKGLSL